MSNRSEAARRRRRSGLGASALAMLAATWMGGSIDARADTLRLKSGEEIEGAIVDATRNTVIVRRAIGGMRQIPVQDLDEIRLDLGRGGPISGQFLSWADGVYRLRAGNEEVWISDGAILKRDPHQASMPSPQPPPPGPEQQPAADTAAAAIAAPEPEPTAAAPAPDPAATKAESEPAAPAPAPEAAAAKTEPEPPASAPEPEQSAALAEPEQTAAPEAAGAGGTVAVKASVQPATTGADGLVFKIELSQPSEKTVVLVYGTVDGTAKAGEDYEPQQGVITLAPGTRSGEIEVPLINHEPSNEDKRFELFLIADPSVAEVVDKRIIATIQGGN